MSNSEVRADSAQDIELLEQTEQPFDDLTEEKFVKASLEGANEPSDDLLITNDEGTLSGNLDDKNCDIELESDNES